MAEPTGRAFFEAWLDRKLQGRRWRLVKPMRVTREWRRIYGPRGAYARVTISAEPADVFSFSAEGAWRNDDDRQEYEPYVLDGIAHFLVAGAREPVLGLRLTLESTDVHDVDSNGNAFFEATKEALQLILRGDEELIENITLVHP